MENDEKLLRYYGLEIKREGYWVTEHQKRIAFYVGLLSALIGGTLAGLLQAEEWYYWAIFTIGPILIISVAKIGSQAIRRIYQRWLETITVLAKIEEDLGFAKRREQSLDQPNNWVANEQYIPGRHMESVKPNRCTSSKQWVKEHLEKEDTYQGKTNKIFIYSEKIGWFLLVAISIIAFAKLIFSK